MVPACGLCVMANAPSEAKLGLWRVFVHLAKRVLQTVIPFKRKLAESDRRLPRGQIRFLIRFFYLSNSIESLFEELKDLIPGEDREQTIADHAEGTPLLTAARSGRLGCRDHRGTPETTKTHRIAPKLKLWRFCRGSSNS